MADSATFQNSLGIVLGRFQPFHEGHETLIRQALKFSERVAVILGSAGGARSVRNPWTAAERQEMIRSRFALEPSLLSRLTFLPIQDHFDNPTRWQNEVREALRSVLSGGHRSDGRDLNGAVFTFDTEDGLSDARLFPEWSPVAIPFPEQSERASTLRASYFQDSANLELVRGLSKEVRLWLQEFSETTEYQRLQEEQKALDRYQKEWQRAPFPPNFLTTDCVLIQAGHVLLIQRKNPPAAGLWAMPGGFLDQDETLFTCAIRELKEETGVEIRTEVLRNSLVRVQTFDHPLRSARKRTVTQAHCFLVPGSSPAPFRAGDDAAQARWFPLAELEGMRSNLAEDHFFVIRSFLPFLPPQA